MEQPLRKNNFLSEYLNVWREKVKTFASNVFSPPYLPSRFIWFFLLIAITNFSVILMSYSPHYWDSAFQNKGVAPSNLVYEVPLTDWFIASIVYLSIALFCLVVFNFRWSFIGWLTAEIIHFWGMGNWLDNCSYDRWSTFLGNLCNSFDGRTYWIIVATLLGVMVSTYTNPGADSIPRQQIKKKLPRVFIIASLVWSFLLIFIVASSTHKSSYGWVPLEISVNPPPLENASYAYDSKDNQLILFGGITEYKNGKPIYKNETWMWDGVQWKNVTPPLSVGESPRFRTSASMAYDEENDVIVLYGGFYNNSGLCDTWLWNGERWTFFCPPNCPGARFGHEMYYDSIRKKIVLYGGYNNNKFFNDAWEWDGYTWSEIEMKGDSPLASSYALTYNPDEQFALGLLSGSPGGTWIFKDNQWTQVNTTSPSNRHSMSLIYEPEKKIFVTFGGYSEGHALNDTWFFDGTNWKLFTDSKSQPPIRSNMVMWYDEVRKHIMVFGGLDNFNIYNDTWELILP